MRVQKFMNDHILNSTKGPYIKYVGGGKEGGGAEDLCGGHEIF